MGGSALGVEGCEDGRLRPYGTVHTIAGRSVERTRLLVVHHTYGRVLGGIVSYERGIPVNPKVCFACGGEAVRPSSSWSVRVEVVVFVDVMVR